MRLLAAVTIAVAVAVCVAVIVLALREFGQWRRRYLERHSTWIDVTVNTSDTTYVSVQRVAETLLGGRVVLDEQHIGFVGHHNPSWSAHVMKLQDKAWDRAAVLNRPQTE